MTTYDYGRNGAKTSDLVDCLSDQLHVTAAENTIPNVEKNSQLMTVNSFVHWNEMGGRWVPSNTQNPARNHNGNNAWTTWQIKRPEKSINGLYIPLMLHKTTGRDDNGRQYAGAGESEMWSLRRSSLLWLYPSMVCIKKCTWPVSANERAVYVIVNQVAVV